MQDLKKQLEALKVTPTEINDWKSLFSRADFEKRELEGELRHMQRQKLALEK